MQSKSSDIFYIMIRFWNFLIANYKWLTLNVSKPFKVQTVLVLKHKKRGDHNIYHSCTRLTTNDSGIDEAFKSMHQSIMTKTKIYASKEWIVLDAVIKHGINIFEC